MKKMQQKLFVVLLVIVFTLIPRLSKATDKSDYYSDIIQNGKYCIACHVSSNFNRNESQDKAQYKDVVFLKDVERGIEYFSLYAHADESKYYQWIELLQYGDKQYACIRLNKKEIDITEEQTRQFKEIKQSDYAYWTFFGKPKAQAIGQLFSSLAEITVKNKLLKNYNAEYKNSGSYEQDGEKFFFDEYIITNPEQAKLQLQYLNGKLLYSIKFIDDGKVSHPYIFASTLKEDRIDAITFEKFDDNTDEIIKALLARIKK